MNLEYLQNQGFFTSTYAAQFVENYYNKDEKNSISENKTVSLAPTRVKQGLHLIKKC